MTLKMPLNVTRSPADLAEGAAAPPRFAMPALACDTHCHVFGPGDVFAYAPERSYTPADAPRQALAAMHEAIGVSRAVVVQATCHGTDNAAMLDAVAASGGRYRGVAIVDETLDDRLAERLHQGGVRGVRFNFLKQLGEAPSAAVLRHVVARIKPLGWHIVVLMSPPDIAEHFDMLQSLPVPFVIDHMGRPPVEAGPEAAGFQTLLRLLACGHGWVKLSGGERISNAGPPFHDAVPFGQALVRAVPERVLWGTDWPHPNIVKFMPREADLVDLVKLYAPAAAQRQALLVDNPALLYGFTA